MQFLDGDSDGDADRAGGAVKRRSRWIGNRRYRSEQKTRRVVEEDTLQ